MKNGTPGPAPVLDIEPQRRIGLGRRVAGDAVDLAVALVLAAHVVGRVGSGIDPKTDVHRVLESRWVPPAGGSIAARGDDLHQVVDDHVAERADRVIEVAAVLDAEALGHRDLRPSATWLRFQTGSKIVFANRR